MDLLKSLKLSNWVNHAMQMKKGNLKSKVPRIKKKWLNLPNHCMNSCTYTHTEGG